MSSYSSSEPHRAPQPASLLGDEHPLVVALEDHRRAVERCVGVLGLLALAALAALAGLDRATWVLACGAGVGLVLAASLWARTTLRNAEVLALIIRGDGAIPVRAVRRTRERLRSEDRRAGLARSLQLMSGSPTRRPRSAETTRTCSGTSSPAGDSCFAPDHAAALRD